MKKTILMFSILLLLAGCVMQSATQNLREGLPLFSGRNLNFVISYLGYPNDERQIAGKKIYTWNSSNTFTTLNTVRTPFSGTAFGVGGGISYQGQTTSVVPETHNYQCNIRLIADKNGIIENWEWSGNEGGCQRYSDGLSRLIEGAEAHKKRLSKKP